MGFNFDKEVKKFKRKFKDVSKDFEDLMGKGHEAGRKYGKHAKKEMARLGNSVSEHMNHVFERHDIPGKFRHAMAHLRVISDVEDKGSHIEINAELPGVERKNLLLKITTNHVEIKAHRLEHAEVSRKGLHRKAVHERYFERRIPLPGHVEHEKAKASFKNGLLKIIIPKKDVERKMKVS